MQPEPQHPSTELWRRTPFTVLPLILGVVGGLLFIPFHRVVFDYLQVSISLFIRIGLCLLAFPLEYLRLIQFFGSLDPNIPHGVLAIFHFIVWVWSWLIMDSQTKVDWSDFRNDYRSLSDLIWAYQILLIPAMILWHLKFEIKKDAPVYPVDRRRSTVSTDSITVSITSDSDGSYDSC